MSECYTLRTKSRFLLTEIIDSGNFFFLQFNLLGKMKDQFAYYMLVYLYIGNLLP